MGWSLSKCLVRSGIPAAVFAIGMSVKDMVRASPGENMTEIIFVDFGLMAILWIGAALFLFLVSRVYPGLQ